MKLHELLASVAKRLTTVYADQETAYTVAWYLVQAATEKSRAELLVQEKIILSSEQEKLLDSWIASHVIDHKPLAYSIGFVPFLDLKLAIRPPLLIPRSETENWCAQLIQELKIVLEKLTQEEQKKIRILDLCTGSGCIALAVAHAFPTISVDAVDKADYAIKLAHENMIANTITNLKLIESDLFCALDSQNPQPKYDLIVANPPYITQDAWHNLEPGVQKWEDYDALVAPDNGMHLIKKILSHSTNWLNPESPLIPIIDQVWIEIGYDQGEKSLDYCKKIGYSNAHLIQDIYDNNRVIKGTPDYDLFKQNFSKN